MRRQLRLTFLQYFDISYIIFQLFMLKLKNSANLC